MPTGINSPALLQWQKKKKRPWCLNFLVRGALFRKRREKEEPELETKEARLYEKKEKQDMEESLRKKGIADFLAVIHYYNHHAHNNPPSKFSYHLYIMQIAPTILLLDCPVMPSLKNRKEMQRS